MLDLRCRTSAFPEHSILIGANGSDSREEGSGLACWPPSLTGEPSLTVSMEDYRGLSRWVFTIENYWISFHGGLLVSRDWW